MQNKETEPPADRPPAEERILTAAREEFGAKGFFGARTQSIADAAGVNKAMLHYYFRSKEVLYGEVIRSALQNLFSGILREWFTERTMPEKVEAVVDYYLNMLRDDPSLMKIIMREAVDGGGKMKKIFINDSVIPPFGEESPIQDLLRDFADNLGMEPMEALHIYISIIGMCVISFISPIMLEIIAKYDTSDFDSFLNDRRRAIKAVLSAFVENALEGGGREH